MAHINTRLLPFNDYRFAKLVTVIGDPMRAFGALVVTLELLHDHWLEHQGIPKHCWPDELNPVLMAGLAIEKDGIVYVEGGKQQCATLAKCSGAGKRSAERRQAKKTIARKRTQKAPTQVQHMSTYVEHMCTYDEHMLPTVQRQTTTVEAPKPEAHAPVTPIDDTKQKARAFIGAYVQAFVNRYGARPDLSRKVQGQILLFLRDTPLERACNLIQVYLQMDDPWFKTKCHDIQTFLENLGKVNIALETGKNPNEAPKKDLFDFLKPAPKGLPDARS